jgi:hypothetical protein
MNAQYGWCPVCSGYFALTKLGRMRKHTRVITGSTPLLNGTRESCPGTGRNPEGGGV